MGLLNLYVFYIYYIDTQPLSDFIESCADKIAAAKLCFKWAKMEFTKRKFFIWTPKTDKKTA